MRGHDFCQSHDHCYDMRSHDHIKVTWPMDLWLMFFYLFLNHVTIKNIYNICINVDMSKWSLILVNYDVVILHVHWLVVFCNFSIRFVIQCICVKVVLLIFYEYYCAWDFLSWKWFFVSTSHECTKGHQIEFSWILSPSLSLCTFNLCICLNHVCYSHILIVWAWVQWVCPVLYFVSFLMLAKINSNCL